MYEWENAFNQTILERGMIKLETLRDEPENDRFFHELDYLFLDFLPTMPDGDKTRLVLAVLRAVMSRPGITERMTADIGRLCVAVLARSARKNTAEHKLIRDELLSMVSEAYTPEGAGFILRTALATLPEEKTSDAFTDALIRNVPDRIKIADAIEIFTALRCPEVSKRAYSRLADRCREVNAADQLIADLKRHLSDPDMFAPSLALVLKELVPEAEWPGVYEEILSSGEMRLGKYTLMFMEKDYERLMDTIDQHDQYGYIFENFEKELKKALPGRALVYRVSVAERALAAAKNKYDYRQAVKFLKKASSYPDGKEMVAAAAKFWRENNPRKTSLLEALDRAKL